MSVMIRAMHRTYAVRACGRACADMQPGTRPALPLPPPVSIAELLRTHPGMELDPDALASMETSDTLH